MTKRVNFIGNINDFRVALLGSMGFSASYIAGETGYSTGQIQYRLRLCGTKLSDYRNGKSSVSHVVWQKSREIVADKLRRNFRRAQ